MANAIFFWFEQFIESKDLNSIVALIKHMLQKENDFEIIELLRKEPTHLREVSKKLNLIPSTTMRALRRLREENIVDFKKEGRNNKYFLKESLEAQSVLIMAEQYKLTRLLQEPTLRRIIGDLRANTKGELIMLFGSYAKGLAKESSDIDIYVETEDSALKRRLEKIDARLSIKIGKFEKDSLLIKEIIKNHIIIQNAERYYSLIK
jgi:predicted nucleotidyltransferase